MDDKAPSLCRLCQVPLQNVTEWRKHAKSELHVYHLRLKVGQTVAPFSPASGEAIASIKRHSPENPTATSSDVLSDSDSDSETEPLSLPSPRDFIPEICLFCNETSSTFEDSLAHMSKTHSFVVPYPEALAVDLVVVLEYLQEIVYFYRECILCATHRATVEGIQQHMTAKGHCRFEINSETKELYHTSDDAGLSQYRLGEREEDAVVRLPSGKAISRRARPNEQVYPRFTAQQALDGRMQGPIAPMQYRRSGQIISRTAGEQSGPTPASMQLAQLTKGDQRSLAHLADHEVRSVISSQMRVVDRARRAQTRAQLKMERAKNKTLMQRSQIGYRVNLAAG